MDAEPFRNAREVPDGGTADLGSGRDVGPDLDLGPDPDLGPDMGAPFDPGPPRIVPDTFFEGAGSVIPAVVYIVNPALEPGDALRAPPGVVFVDSRVEAGRGAVAFRLPTDTEFGAGATRTLSFRHERNGSQIGQFDVEAQGLPEAILSGPVDVNSLAPLHAELRVRPDFTPSGPAILRALGPIRVDADLDLSAAGPEPGPGGYVGATLSAPAEGLAPGADGALSGCPGAGGGGGARDDGGDGANEGGQGFGMGGAAILLDDLVPPIAELGGSGGGRGADRAGAADPPGLGGGGGGVLLLSTEGELLGDALLAARGGDGGASPQGGCSPMSVGAGGGGAGGTLVLRGRGGPIELRADVAGGARGENGGRSGGAGSPGFLLVGSSTTTALAGRRLPEWGADQPVIGERRFPLSVRGAAEPLTVFPDRDPVRFDAAGRAEIELDRGLQEACLDPEISDLPPSCIQVVVF